MNNGIDEEAHFVAGKKLSSSMQIRHKIFVLKRNESKIRILIPLNDAQLSQAMIHFDKRMNKKIRKTSFKKMLRLQAEGDDRRRNKFCQTIAKASNVVSILLITFNRFSLCLIAAPW